MNIDRKDVLERFEWLSQFPRATYNEAEVQAALKERCSSNGWKTVQDKKGNLVVYVPASAGYESSPTLILQSHVDMVAEKVASSNHDFSKDGIKLIYDGDWLRADGTTLGADNGIGVALALTLAEMNENHPALELLFTVDEEKTMSGAGNVEPELFQGKYLINLDGGFDQFIVGCAGGNKLILNLPVEWRKAKNNRAFSISVSGLKGGHSGQDINLNRANSNILLARTYLDLQAHLDNEIEVISIEGGSAPNAIPRSSAVHFFLAESDVKQAQKCIANFEKLINNEYKLSDPNIKITMSESVDVSGQKVISEQDALLFFQSVTVLPNDQLRKSLEFEDLSETSANISNLVLENGVTDAKIKMSLRSSEPSQLTYLNERISAYCNIAGIDLETVSGYPSWVVRLDSPLNDIIKESYQELFQQEIVLSATHGGLECGFLLEKMPHLQAISFGPQNENLHSPDECLNLPSLSLCWQYLNHLASTKRWNKI